jgi:hypothetical protein
MKSRIARSMSRRSRITRSMNRSIIKRIRNRRSRITMTSSSSRSLWPVLNQILVGLLRRGIDPFQGLRLQRIAQRKETWTYI